MAELKKNFENDAKVTVVLGDLKKTDLLISLNRDFRKYNNIRRKTD